MSAPTIPGPQQWGPGMGADAAPSALAAPTPTHRGESLKQRIRLIGSVAIALLAMLTLAFGGPDEAEAGHSSERVVIWADDSANQERTEGAPQQSVVNGWTGNALLDLISEQLDDAPPADHRPATLLTLGVLLLGLGIATTPGLRRT